LNVVGDIVENISNAAIVVTELLYFRAVKLTH